MNCLAIYYFLIYCIHITDIGMRGGLSLTVKDNHDLKAAGDEHAFVARTDPQEKINCVNDRFRPISQSARKELPGQDNRLSDSAFVPTISSGICGSQGTSRANLPAAGMLERMGCRTIGRRNDNSLAP